MTSTQENHEVHEHWEVIFASHISRYLYFPHYNFFEKCHKYDNLEVENSDSPSFMDINLADILQELQGFCKDENKKKDGGNTYRVKQDAEFVVCFFSVLLCGIFQGLMQR